MSTADTSSLPIMEVVDFLLTRPTDEQILAFRLSTETQALASELLEKNREGTLSRDERYELDKLLHLDTFMTLLKAKLRLKMKSHG